MLVRSGKREDDPLNLAHAYTWGAYGKSPLGIRYELPKQLAGLSKLKISASLAGRKQVARTVRFTTSVNVPGLPIDAVLEKYRNLLSDVNLPFEPDNLELDPNLFKLAILDKQMQEEGKRSIFPRQLRRLSLTKNNHYTNILETPVSGLHTVQLTTAGRSRKGFQYQRQAPILFQSRKDCPKHWIQFLGRNWVKQITDLRGGRGTLNTKQGGCIAPAFRIFVSVISFSPQRSGHAWRGHGA